MLIRTAVPNDLPALLDLLGEDAIRPFDEPASITDRQREAMDEIVANPDAEILVGEPDGRLVATARVDYLRVLMYDGGLICQVESVRTASDLRSRGLGARLMAHIVDEARRRGCARVQLTSNRQRERARAFYERLGFEPTHLGFKLHLA